jgi:archaellum biogenesis protein FlaJ (TadC family)
MIGISCLGVWIIYRAAPREIRTLQGEAGLRSQEKVRKAFIMLAPIGLALAALATLVKIDFGIMLLGLGLLLLPVGILAKRVDRKIKKQDEDIATFLRVLGQPSAP